MKLDPDDVPAQLRALPARAPDLLVDERIRRRAHAAFLRASRRDERWLARLDGWYARLEPTLAVSVTVGYLAWAFHVTSSLAR
jgi:hypothetical protein